MRAWNLLLMTYLSSKPDLTQLLPMLTAVHVKRLEVA
jgi:hypothetical protein